jgi:choline dehydrogenase-like flavoprotein
VGGQWPIHDDRERHHAPSPINVIIIGAGTGGLCLAQGLKRAGMSVAVYERDRTRRDGLQGYRVGIDADGKRALRANLPPELYNTFLATCARRPVYANQLTHKMKFLFSAGPEVLKAGSRSPARSTWRRAGRPGRRDGSRRR